MATMAAIQCLNLRDSVASPTSCQASAVSPVAEVARESPGETAGQHVEQLRCREGAHHLVKNLDQVFLGGGIVAQASKLGFRKAESRSKRFRLFAFGAQT